MNTLMLLLVLVISIISGQAHADDCASRVSYNGQGAGEVVFDAQAHMSKGMLCSDCHEVRGIGFPLFEMKKGAGKVSMRKMALGRACGYCHDGKQSFSAMDDFQCSRCHQK